MERRKFTREFKVEAVRLIKDRGVSYVQASHDLKVHTSQLRDWVKKFADDPHHAFPGNGQMKPEQLEIARLIAIQLDDNVEGTRALELDHAPRILLGGSLGQAL